MSNHCAVCDHPERADIDAAIVGATVPFRAIGKRYGMSHMSAIRHAANHIPSLLREAHDAEVATEATALMERVLGLVEKAEWWHEEAKQLLEDAKRPADARDDDRKPAGEFRDRAAAIQVGTRAVRVIGGVLELMGKVSGELQSAVTVIEINLGGQASKIPAPEVVEFFSEALGVLSEELEAHPEAKARAMARLKELHERRAAGPRRLVVNGGNS